jgi:hypothetical protein
MTEAYVAPVSLSQQIDKIVFELATRPGDFRKRFAETGLPAAALYVEAFPESRREDASFVLRVIADRAKAPLEDLQVAAEKVMSLQFHLNWYLERCREQEVIERYEGAQQ